MKTRHKKRKEIHDETLAMYRDHIRNQYNILFGPDATPPLTDEHEALVKDWEASLLTKDIGEKDIKSQEFFGFDVDPDGLLARSTSRPWFVIERDNGDVCIIRPVAGLPPAEGRVICIFPLDPKDSSVRLKTKQWADAELTMRSVRQHGDLRRAVLMARAFIEKRSDRRTLAQRSATMLAIDKALNYGNESPPEWDPD